MDGKSTSYSREGVFKYMLTTYGRTSEFLVLSRDGPRILYASTFTIETEGLDEKHLASLKRDQATCILLTYIDNLQEIHTNKCELKGVITR